MPRSLLPLAACLTLILTATSFPAHLAADKVAIDQEATMLAITINGQPFATYHFADDQPKPFMLPVHTASGTVINRALDDASDADHPHHKGMWNAIDEVNEVKFWAEKGIIRNVGVKTLSTDGDSASFEAVNEWRHPETGVPQLTETAIITVHPSRLLVYDMRLTASHVDVTFEDTKEGLFGFRVAPSMKERTVVTLSRPMGLRRQKNAGERRTTGLIITEMSTARRSAWPLWIIQRTSGLHVIMCVTTVCSPSVRSEKNRIPMAPTSPLRIT